MTETSDSIYKQVGKDNPELQDKIKNLGVFAPESVEGFPEHQVVLTRDAADKVYSLLEREGRLDLRLRIQVSAGGCAGLEHHTYFDERILDGDSMMEQGDIQIIIDKASAPYLSGSVIGYEDTLEKQGFTLDNPNATGACSCGSSFH